ncbi:hypothetical protein [Candidatus Odyssella thessalonicensis]|uniref:hypothetical protein n=1 Tax=Candidatus Odyssella thessalonicensis TaxID=84647 RepID=UPI0003014C45|nr:hypothetical protein [Candidatus Odyssella thessalonicensis]
MVIIFGTGQLAEVAFQYLTRDTAHKIVAFTVDQEYMTSTTFMGLPVVPFESIESIYPPGQVKMFIPISYYKLNQLREKNIFKQKPKGTHLLAIFILLVCNIKKQWEKIVLFLIKTLCSPG